MQRGPTERDRKVVPRWRQLGRTPAAELISANKRLPTSHGGLLELQEQEANWKENKTLGSAADLLPLAIVLGNDSLATQVAEFVMAQATGPTLLRQVAGEQLRQGGNHPERNPLLGINYYRAKIALAKRQLELYPRNSIYTIGQLEKGQLSP
jgi:hypothetical protein